MADNFNERDFFTGNALIPGETQSVYAPPPGGGVFTTKLSVLANWAQSASLFPMIMGTACCAIEGMATAGSRFDGLERFGMLFRFSPRQCDAMVVFGRVSAKMAPVIRQLYDQMPEPKWVVAVGACASCGGVFNNYAIVQGIDKIVPVDVYVAGCPPTPEAIMQGLNMLQQKIVSGAPHPRDPQEYMPEVVRDPNLGRVQR